MNPRERALWDANIKLQDCITSGNLTEKDTVLSPFRDSATPGLLVPDARKDLQVGTVVAMETGQISLAQSLLGQETGSTFILEMLLEHGWEIEQAFNAVGDTTRKSLFHNESLVKWLLSHGAHPSAVYWTGMVPVEATAQNALLPMVRLLASSGGRVQSTDAIIKASIGHAEDEPDRLEVVRCLVGCGAPIDAYNIQFSDFSRYMSLISIKGKLTALHHAARAGKADMVALLMHMGANRNLMTFAEKTALELAIENGHGEAASLLRI
ncbi:MAG: hypothetical protein Q9187_000069 [Circinaria calcarea]